MVRARAPIAPVLLVVIAVAVGALWWLGVADEPSAESGARLEAVDEDEVRRHAEVAAAAPMREEQAERLVTGSPGPGARREVASIAADPADVPPLVLEVRHADGAPAPDTDVVVARFGEFLGRGITGDDGRVELPGAGVEPLSVYLAGAVMPLLAVELPSGEGGHRVDLPGTGVLAGRVLVDGAAPGVPVPLVMPDLQPAERLPRTVTGPLRRRDVGVAHFLRGPSFRTRADGSFRIVGLPEGRTVAVTSAATYRFASGQEAVALSVPSHDVLLELVTEPAIVGRVVDESGTSVREAMISYGLSTESMSFSGPAVWTDDDGRFRIPVTRDYRPLRNAALQIRAEAGLAALVVAGADFDPGAGLDLGDVPLVSTWDVAFVVRRPDGSPVPGAIAVVDGSADAESEPTAEDGAGLLVGLTPGASTFTVWADRAQAVVVDLPRAPGPPVEVVVQPCPCLQVGLVLPDDAGSEGRPADATRDETAASPSPLRLVVAAEQRLFEPEDGFGPGSARERVGGFRVTYSMTRNDGERMSGRVVMPLSLDEPLVLSCLEAGVPFELSVHDALDAVLWGPRGYVATSGVQTVRIELAASPRSVTVRVLDEAGQPVEGAQVQLFGDKSGPGVRSDRAGEAVFAAVMAARLGVMARAPGFAPLRVEDLVVPEHGVIEVVLPVARRVTLRIQDQAGRPASAVDVEVTLSGDRDGNARAIGEDRSEWLIDGLPPEEITIHAGVGGREFELVHDARVPDALIVVPAFGSLRVRWAGQLGVDSAWQVAWTGPDDAEWLTRSVTTRGAAYPQPDEHGFHVVPDGDLERRETLIPVIFPGPRAVALGTSFPPTLHAGPTRVEVVAGGTALVLLEPALEDG